ncbi:MAG: methyltransferase domain-containing protein [Pseudomonadota bacterium]
MSETKSFLGDVYDLRAAEDVRALYRDWAPDYDEELRGAGYASPSRCAEALAGAAEDLAAPVLDLGCGTGLSGLALKAAGFSTIDGADVSPEMLAAAEATGVYRRLVPIAPDGSPPGEPGEHAHVAAVGVLGPGHAPAETVHAVMRLLPPGGCFVFTLNDHALADRRFEGAVREVVDAGWARLLLREHGDHLPGIGLSATVYLLQRC